MYYYNNELPPQQGWICPKCGRVNAPWVPTCGCVSSQTSGTPHLVKTSSIPRDSHEIAKDEPQIEPNLILPERMERGEMYEVGDSIVVMNSEDYYDLLCKSWEKDEPQTKGLEQFRVGLEYHTDTTHFGKVKGESVTTNKVEDEPQTNADQHVQHVESVEPTWTKEKHEAFYTFLWNTINPNEMEEYIEMYEAKDEPQTEKGGCTNCDGKDLCNNAFTEISQYCGAYEPQNGYQTFNGTNVYVSRLEDEPQSERSE